MKIYVFDVHGTLVNNPTVSDEDVRKMLMVLRAAGHRLVIMTGLPKSVPHPLKKLVDDVWEKPVAFRDKCDENTVVFDDNVMLLRGVARLGIPVVAASQMGEWIANEGWNDGSRRQDATGGAATGGP